MKYKFEQGTDYKQTLDEQIDLIVGNDIPDDKKRVEMVDELIEAYYEQVGHIPDNRQLNKLAYWILDVDRDKHPDKLTKEEYPILSHTQARRRSKREFSNDSIEVFTISGQHRVSGKRKPKQFKVFGEY